MKKQNAITLIALIITIIILLILSGVVINLAIGENGIMNMAKQAGEDYKIASVKERVEEEIMALEADKIVKGEKLTVEQALIGIKEKEVFEEIDLAEEIGISEGYEIKLGYNEFGNVIILGIEKETGIKIVTNVTPKGYTNQDVAVTISVKPEGTKISNIEVPEGMIKQADETYKITKNGTYLVKATLEDGTLVEKEIKINTIDKLPPKEFEITAQNTGEGFIITGTTQDEEETSENACSGIDRYEYVVIDEEGKETTYKESEIKGLVLGTYKVYAVCYDKAGNNTKTKEIEYTKLKPGVEKYGQKVNYTSNGVSDWKIFYINEETNETFIITSGYLPTDKIPSEAGMRTEKNYIAYWEFNKTPDYTEITQNVRDRFMMSWNCSDTNENIKYVSKLLNNNIWSGLVRGDLQEKGASAIGGPTVEMFVSSWNDIHTTDRIVLGKDDFGYGFVRRFYLEC